jgi:hypothetical protein
MEVRKKADPIVLKQNLFRPQESDLPAAGSGELDSQFEKTS